MSPAFEIFIDKIVQTLKSMNLNVQKDIVDDIIIEIKEFKVNYAYSSIDVTDALSGLILLTQKEFLECRIKCNVFLKSKIGTTLTARNIEVLYSPIEEEKDQTAKLLRDYLLDIQPLKSMTEKDVGFVKKAIENIFE
ncbi:conserved hypothetical protein [Caldicellulosiruptor hydrothermalis 108]|uniref:Uncharacterized protein n=1 Tax=Caldicellulosiruptor hydrothermalis (strain DSM 18901 / VKM B-2411 / 108) TaxID=632292 RepID=E4QAH7_CALH1|nr:hypothetical protein [Caldicellulosiruptor hydrothermalis]ADQ08281.1 conserved hypothetical protein [Caldicellulosiruptor hydrothermalis 108]